MCSFHEILCLLLLPCSRKFRRIGVAVLCQHHFGLTLTGALRCLRAFFVQLRLQVALAQRMVPQFVQLARGRHSHQTVLAALQVLPHEETSGKRVGWTGRHGTLTSGSRQGHQASIPEGVVVFDLLMDGTVWNLPPWIRSGQFKAQYYEYT